MEKIKLTANILFSGIGCQERGFQNSELFDMDIITTSDIDKDAIVSYASIHNGLTKELVENYDYPSKEEMIADMERMNIGFEPNKGTVFDWKKLARKKDKMKGIEIYWLACKLSHQMGDISKIKKLPYADLWTISFCCQDISVAGKMKGLTPDSGTRSSLLWENIKLLKDSVERNEAPKYLMFENVKNLVSKKFINDFNSLLEVLDELGYNSYWKVLNAAECGIPQMRQRVFCIGIRKDIDTKKMDFPIPFDNGLRLKDILQPINEIEEKYFINTDRARNLIEQLAAKGQLHGDRETCDSTILDPSTREICNCITARYDASIQNKKQIGMCVAEPVQKRLGGLFDNETKHQAGSVWDTDNLSPTLDTMAGGLRQPCVVIGSTQEHAYVGNGDLCPTLNAAMGLGGGHVPMIGYDNKSNVIGHLDDNSNQRQVVYNKENDAPTLQAAMGMGGGNVPLIIDNNTNKPILLGNTTPSGKSQCNAVYSTEGVSQTLCAGTHGYATGSIADMYRIRKLTPIETGILMGLTRNDVEKCMANGMSNSALYKQHGNGICCSCVELLAEHLYKAQYNIDFICTDEKNVNFNIPQS